MSTSAQNTNTTIKQMAGSIGGQSSQTATPNPTFSKTEDDGDYFLVSRGSLLRSKEVCQAPSGSTAAASDTKDNQKIPPQQKEEVPAKVAGKSVKAVMSGAHRSGNSMTVYAKLVSYVGFTSGANATQFPVLPIQVSTFQDYSSYQLVYDEYRVKSVDMHVEVTPSASPLTLGRSWGAAFDPGNSGAYSIIYDTLSAQKAIGPILIATAFSSPQPRTATGYHKLSSGKLLPILNCGSGTLAPLLGGSWIATSDNSAVHGYVKGAVDALGAAITSTMGIYLIAHVEFRMRT